MPVISIVTNLPPADVFRMVGETAQAMEFRVSRIESDEFVIESGSQMMAIFFGLMVQPYCKFNTVVSPNEHNHTEVLIRWSSNLFTQGGLIGMPRVKKKANKLADGIEEEIARNGGQILASGQK